MIYLNSRIYRVFSLILADCFKILATFFIILMSCLKLLDLFPLWKCHMLDSFLNILEFLKIIL